MPLNKARQELISLKALSGSSPPTPSLDLLVRRPRVGVGCLLVCDSHTGHVLVGARKGSHGEGQLALPGGHLEYGASFQECASAELQEECGLQVLPGRWVGPVHTSNNVMLDSDLHYITVFMAARVSAEEAAAIVNVEEDKCEGWVWLPLALLRDAPPLPLFLPLQLFLGANGEALLEGALPPSKE
jgi:8-oxo-dGTP diphosphatase